MKHFFFVFYTIFAGLDCSQQLTDHWHQKYKGLCSLALSHSSCCYWRRRVFFVWGSFHDLLSSRLRSCFVVVILHTTVSITGHCLTGRPWIKNKKNNLILQNTDIRLCLWRLPRANNDTVQLTASHSYHSSTHFTSALHLGFPPQHRHFKRSTQQMFYKGLTDWLNAEIPQTELPYKSLYL